MPPVVRHTSPTDANPGATLLDIEEYATIKTVIAPVCLPSAGFVFGRPGSVLSKST